MAHGHGATTLPIWRTCDLPEAPDYTSPGGASEIRLLPSFPAGELAHAVALPMHTSTAAVVSRITEIFYVIAGRGELWRAGQGVEEIVELKPERCATIPPGVSFQYRTGVVPLELMVFSAPRWEREDWSEAPVGHWPAGASIDPPGDAPWTTHDMRPEADYLASDGSEIRLLPEVDAGGLAHCTLPSGTFSAAVRHKTVQEVWYVLEGGGQLWRAADGDEEVVRLVPRRGLTIPVGVSFQFRADEADDLRILIATFPHWPGPEEAVPSAPRWEGAEGR